METNKRSNTNQAGTLPVNAVILGGEIIVTAVNLSGKYAKQVLSRIETSETLTPTMRKHILDGFNDYAREISELLTVLTQHTDLTKN